MQDNAIEKYREKLVEYLTYYYEGELILLDLPESILRKVLFSPLLFSEKELEFPYKGSKLYEALKKIDFTNVSFDGVSVKNTDLSGFKGIKINPQTIADKSLYRTKLSGVKFIGPFDDCIISEADFTGSVGALINPQTVLNKDLSFCIFEGVEFIGSFDGTKIIGSNFTGSKGAIIDSNNLLQEDEKIVVYRTSYETNLNDALIIEEKKELYSALYKVNLKDASIINGLSIDDYKALENLEGALFISEEDAKVLKKQI